MNPQTITLTEEQYRSLLKAVGIAGSLYGPLSDFVDDIYRKESKNFEELETILCAHAYRFKCDMLISIYDDKAMLDMEGEWYDNLTDDILEYDEYVLHESLANKLAWRDFRRFYSQAEIQVLAEKNDGYFGVEIYDYEKKYWDEFNEHGFERLVIKK